MRAGAALGRFEASEIRSVAFERRHVARSSDSSYTREPIPRFLFVPGVASPLSFVSRLSGGFVRRSTFVVDSPPPSTARWLTVLLSLLFITAQLLKREWKMLVFLTLPPVRQWDFKQLPSEKILARNVRNGLISNERSIARREI